MPLSALTAETLFSAKTRSTLTFAELGEKLGRSEVAVAAIFYGQQRASHEDVLALAEALSIPEEALQELENFPSRGEEVIMPPREPLIYRLYEVVMNYGQAYKAVINEKFGDGIMSAIAFSTEVEKDTDPDGTEWVVLKMRGKWLPFKRF